MFTINQTLNIYKNKNCFDFLNKFSSFFSFQNQKLYIFKLKPSIYHEYLIKKDIILYSPSQAKISKILKVSRCTVQKRDIKNMKKSGRRTKSTKSDCKYLSITSLRNRTKSCQELGSDLAQTYGTQVHSSTIRRALMKEDLYCWVARRKPYLRQGNRKITWICHRTQEMNRWTMGKCIMEWWIKIWNFQFKEKTVCKEKSWKTDERIVLGAYSQTWKRFCYDLGIFTSKWCV